MGQHDGKGNDMHPGQRLRQAFVVRRQATDAHHPGATPLDHPVTRQYNKAPPGCRQRDHLQTNALGGGPGCRSLTGVILVDEGHVYAY